MILSLQMKASERPHNVRHNIIAVLGMLIMSSVATVYAIEAEVDRGVITSSEPLWLSVHMNPPLKCEAISVHVQKDGHAATEIEKSCLFWEWNQRKQTWGVVLQSELVDNRYIFREAGVYTITIQVGGESISKIRLFSRICG